MSRGSSWGLVLLLLGGCFAKEQRVCETHASCLTATPTVCFQRKCLPKLCETGASRPCFTGADAARNTGSCKDGLQLCQNNGSAWSPCFGQRLPQKESCDGADNDCNGKIDDGAGDCKCKPPRIRPCYTGSDATPSLVSSCRAGIQYCSAKGLWGPCLGQQLPQATFRRLLATDKAGSIAHLKSCQERDANCDGQLDVDRECACAIGETRACYLGPPGTEGVGRCKAGVQRCIEDGSGRGQWGFCEKQSLPRPEESQECNGVDDDCDGKIDNQTGVSAPLWRPCPDQNCGIQLCKKAVWSLCEVQEICANQLDDNCDGAVDEEKCVPF